MNLTVILDIAIGLIFIYLILSLLAAEIQELIATLLQWRATHLKESIEVLLGGGKGTTEQENIRRLTNRLYANPVIKNINQEAQGKVENWFREQAWKITKFCRGETGKEDNIFGQNSKGFEDEKMTGPSYIAAETFTTTLLEVSQITILNEKLSGLRLEIFKQDRLEDVKEISNDLKSADKLKLNTDLEEKLDTIVEDFRNNKADLITSFERIGYRLNEYAISYQQDLSKWTDRTVFVERINPVKDIFVNKEKRAVALGWLQPSPNEIVEAIKNKESAAYKEIIAAAEVAIKNTIKVQKALKEQALLRIEKIKIEILKRIQANLSRFKLDEQGTSKFEQLQNELNEVIANLKVNLETSNFDLVTSIKEIEIKLNNYIALSETPFSLENDKKNFREQIPSLRQVTLEISRNDTIEKIEGMVHSLRQNKSLKKVHNNEHISFRLNEELKWLKGEFNKIIGDDHNTDLNVSLEQMAEKLDDYIKRSEDGFRESLSLPGNGFVSEQQVKSIRLSKEDFVRQVKDIKHNVFYTISALPKWLRMDSTEIENHISSNAEIYRAIVEAVNDKESATYQGIVAAINDLPEPVKESLSVLARRAKEKVTRVEQEFQQFQQEIEVWFDRSMDRATGVYARNARGVAIFIGFLIAFAANVDTFNMVSRLSTDGDLRDAIAQNAQVVTENCQQDTTQTPAVTPTAESTPVVAPTASPTSPPSISPTSPPDPNTQEQLDCIRGQTNAALEKIALPIGWSTDKLTEQWSLPFLPNEQSANQQQNSNQETQQRRAEQILRRSETENWKAEQQRKAEQRRQKWNYFGLNADEWANTIIKKLDPKYQGNLKFPQSEGSWFIWSLIHVLIPVILLGLLIYSGFRLISQSEWLGFIVLAVFTAFLVIFTNIKVILWVILGWLLSGIAISMGAPFWFDLLNKVINVRNTGPRPASNTKD